jgi:hypothetical protein
MARLALITTADPQRCFDGGNSLLGLVGPRLRATSAVVYRRDVADFLAFYPDPATATNGDLISYLVARASDNPAGWDRRAAVLSYFYERGIEARLWTINPAWILPRRRRGHWRPSR